MLELGFKDFYDVSLGADMTAKYEFEELAESVSTTVSPMCAVSRLIKARDPEAITVFIGPCIGKKSEIVDQKIERNADYVLTYSEIRAIMKARDVSLTPMEDNEQIGSVYGKRFAECKKHFSS